MRKLMVALAAVLALAACSRSDWDGWEDYLDELEEDLPLVVLTDPGAEVWGARLVLAFTITDPEDRTVEVVVEFSLDGGEDWFEATPAAGFDNPFLVNAPSGGALAGTFTWDLAADLGVANYPGLLVRVNPRDPDGTSGTGGPVEVTSFPEVTAADFRADLYADFADGVLDTLAVVDSRDASAWERESLPGALSAPYPDIQANGAAALLWAGGGQVPLDARLVFYCDGGG